MKQIFILYSAHSVLMLFLWFGTPLCGAASVWSKIDNNKYIEPDAKDLEHFTRTSKLVSDLYEPGHFVVNPNLCESKNGANLSLLVMVRSAPRNQNRRIAIRETWGQFVSYGNISIGFMIGTTNNQSIEDSLEVESDLYGDIVRAHFIEHYDNLTLKMISILEWADSYCSKAEFILNVDDDMFINVMQLMAFIENNRSAADQKIIFGYLHKMLKPIRQKSKNQKNVLTQDEYSLGKFPTFISGGAYLISRSAVHDLYTKALTLPFLKLEDVFVTGIVAQLVNVKRIHGFKHYNADSNQNIAFDTPSDVCILRKMISIHGVTPSKQYDLWKKQMDTNINC